LREEIEILEFWGEKGRAAGGTPQSNEMYQPGVGYFDLKTGRMTRPDDRNQQPSTPRGGGGGGGTAAGGGGGSARAGGGGVNKLMQRQTAAQTQLDTFTEARVQSLAKLLEENELLKATTDIERSRLEYIFEQAAIKEKSKATEQEFIKLQQELNELGIEYNAQQQLDRIEAEKQQALANARLKYEREINDLMVARARMMQDIVQQSAGETVFNPLEQQKADLDALLEKYPAVGAAADAAATLATRGFSEMVTGARSAKEVFADFLRSIADALIDTAKTMIAQYIAIGIARMFAGLGGAGGSGDFSPSNAGPFGGSGLSTGLSFDPSGFGRAMGGPVSAGRAHPVGERGPELFVPYQSGTIIPADVTEALAAANNAAQGPLLVPFQADSSNAAMQRPAAGGANGLSVPFLKGAGGSDGAAGMVVIDNEPIRFESVMINSVEYVTRQEAEAIGKRSEQRTLKRMRNNPSTRRAAGIG
jgi:hypothetical protein